jgi:drug/metabolite transporter superfamily protein YnfA
MSIAVSCGRGPAIAALGAYGFVATLQEDNNLGRVLAAYAGIIRRRLNGVGRRR